MVLHTQFGPKRRSLHELAHPLGWLGRSPYFVAALIPLALAAACDGSSLGNGLTADGQSDCAACHGSTGNPAPPVSLSGATSTSDPAVGAHQVHLAGGKIRAAIVCGECHVVPADVDSPGHIDQQPADLTFGSLATTDGAAPTYDAASGKCLNTYCHGGTLSGGRLTEPAWRSGCDGCHGNPPEFAGDPAKAHPRSKECAQCHAAYVDVSGSVVFPGSIHPSATGCDACHGFPPPEPHSQSASCSLCHAGTVTAEGAIDMEGGLHLNGTVEASGPHPEGYVSPSKHGKDFLESGSGACATCHGDDLAGGSSGTSCNKCHSGFRTSCTFCHGGTDNESGAPPDSVSGETGTSAAAVGAHSAHLSPSSSWHAPMGCADCHNVPADALSPGHMSGKAEVVFGVLATAEESAAAYNAGSCSAVYCHGATQSGGTVTEPAWTKVDGTQAACGSCHGLPPTEEHPDMADCSMCHGCVATSDMKITPEGAAFHINGKVNKEGKGKCPTE